MPNLGCCMTLLCPGKCPLEVHVGAAWCYEQCPWNAVGVLWCYLILGGAMGVLWCYCALGDAMVVPHSAILSWAMQLRCCTAMVSWTVPGWCWGPVMVVLWRYDVVLHMVPWCTGKCHGGAVVLWCPGQFYGTSAAWCYDVLDTCLDVLGCPGRYPCMSRPLPQLYNAVWYFSTNQSYYFPSHDSLKKDLR